MFRRNNRTELGLEADPRMIELERQEEEIKRSVRALEAQASVYLGRDYRSRRINDDR